MFNKKLKNQVINLKEFTADSKYLSWLESNPDHLLRCLSTRPTRFAYCGYCQYSLNEQIPDCLYHILKTFTAG